jgi:hypothetical protein
MGLNFKVYILQVNASNFFIKFFDISHSQPNSENNSYDSLVIIVFRALILPFPAKALTVSQPV